MDEEKCVHNNDKATCPNCSEETSSDAPETSETPSEDAPEKAAE